MGTRTRTGQDVVVLGDQPQGVIFLQSHYINSYSTTQKIIALSSAEAELYGMIKGSAHALGMKSLVADFGIDTKINIHTDASAARGIVNRKGLGKLRHIETNQLWIQDKVRDGTIKIFKCKGTENPADSLTKPVKNEDLTWHLKLTGIQLQEGRSSIAPQLDS